MQLTAPVSARLFCGQLECGACRNHEHEDRQFHKDADAVLDFIQDKLEEYVEDNNIAGGDVEQGVRMYMATHIVSSAVNNACSCCLETESIILGGLHFVAMLMFHAHTAAARSCDSKAGTFWDVCVQQADAKSPDMAVIPNQVNFPSPGPYI